MNNNLFHEHDSNWYKSVDELTFADDFMFGKVMENKEICKEILELLLGIKIGDIKYPKLQEVLNPYYDAKSIRLDVFVEDSEKVFDIEIQVASHKSLPMRMRYYQSIMDADTLLKGKKYENLKNSYIIFICLFDPCDGGLPVYTVKQIFEETSKIFDDKSHKILYNTNAFGDEKNKKLKAFLEYVKTKTATDEFTKKLDAMVEDVKHTDKYRREFLTYQVHIDDWKEEGRLVGIAQGEHNAKIETARNFLALGVVTKEQIAQATGLSLAEIEQLQLEIHNA